jgi:hypothetical protein
MVAKNNQVPPEQFQHPEASDSTGMAVVAPTSDNVQVASGAEETLGRSKRKRAIARQRQLDGVNDSNFNDCLCGSVVKPASDGTLMCKQVGCETQWVLIYYSFNCDVSFSFI